MALSLSDSYARKFRTIRGFPSESKVVTRMFHPAGILGTMRRHCRRSMDLGDFVLAVMSRRDCRRVSENRWLANQASKRSDEDPSQTPLSYASTDWIGRSPA
jgi:hypothetical protein